MDPTASNNSSWIALPYSRSQSDGHFNNSDCCSFQPLISVQALISRHRLRRTLDLRQVQGNPLSQHLYSVRVLGSPKSLISM